MIGKVKHWLGIEGVKLELVLPEAVDGKDGVINGNIRFYSKHEQTVTNINVVLVERYSRGRRKEKRIDEYELGQISLERKIVVPAEGSVEIEFNLPFKRMDSDMDLMGRKNFLSGGLVKAMKFAEGVKSEYRVEAEAKVQGVALNPFDKVVIGIV